MVICSTSVEVIVTVGDVKIEQVNNYIFLGCVIEIKGSTEEEYMQQT